MANHGSPDAFVLFGGYDLTPYSMKYELDTIAAVDETTALGMANPQQSLVGVTSGTLKLDGFYDDALNLLNGALAGYPVAAMIAGLEGRTQGQHATVFASDVTMSVQRLLERKKMHRLNATFESSGAVDEGLILQPYGVISGTTTGAALNNLAATTNGGSATLQVTALNLGGGTNLVVKVQDSADNVTFADLATFTAVTVAPASQYLAIVGTIRQYTRAVMTFTGGTSPTATLTVALARF